MFYQKYAMALDEKGLGEQAIAVLQKGIQANAKPLDQLRSTLSALQKRYTKVNTPALRLHTFHHNSWICSPFV